MVNFVVEYLSFLYTCSKRGVSVVKMIFSDFDDTMLQIHSDKNRFNEYQLEVLTKVMDEGISFSIVTGRCVYFFLDRFPKILEYLDYIIASNGSIIYDVKNRSFIYKKILDNNCLKEIIDYSLSNGYGLLLNCLDKQYSEKNVLSEYFSLEDIECEQVIIKIKVQDLNAILGKINNMSDVIINNVSIRGDDCAIDINCNGVLKGNAICWLCKNLGVSLSDTISFGDGENDISVFEVVGKSVAVENSSDNIKKKCDDIALKCSEDGIFHYMEDNILK